MRRKRLDLVKHVSASVINPEQYTIEQLECPKCHKLRIVSFVAKTFADARRTVISLLKIECSICDGTYNPDNITIGFMSNEEKELNRVPEYKSKKILVEDKHGNFRPISRDEFRMTKWDKTLAGLRNGTVDTVALSGVQPMHDKLCHCLQCVPETVYDDLVNHILPL